MSAIEKLTPQDFGREFDIVLFSKWKSAYNKFVDRKSVV